MDTDELSRDVFPYRALRSYPSRVPFPLAEHLPDEAAGGGRGHRPQLGSGREVRLMYSNLYGHAMASARVACVAALTELGDGNAHASLGLGAEASERLVDCWRAALPAMLVRFADIRKEVQLL